MVALVHAAQNAQRHRDAARVRCGTLCQRAKSEDVSGQRRGFLAKNTLFWQKRRQLWAKKPRLLPKRPSIGQKEPFLGQKLFLLAKERRLWPESLCSGQGTTKPSIDGFSKTNDGNAVWKTEPTPQRSFSFNAERPVVTPVLSSTPGASPFPSGCAAVAGARGFRAGLCIRRAVRDTSG